MADKNFKVKTGLDLPAPLPATQGGTGQTSLSNAINALLPDQSSANAKYLSSNGSSTLWAIVPQQTVTDGAAGAKIYVGTTTPSGQSTGDIWIDNSGGLSIQTTKGDLIGYSASGQIRVAVGTNGQVLIADSTQASGIKWGTAGISTGKSIAMAIVFGG